MSISLVNEAIREIASGVKSIAIDDGLIKSDDLKNLASAFANSKKLEIVSVENNSLDDAAVKKLFEKASQSITKLNLRANKLTAKTAKFLLKDCKLQWLRQIDLGANQLKDAGVDLLAEWLRAPQNVLQELDLSSNDVTAVGTKVLAAAMNQRTTLTRLSLANNPITNVGAFELSQAMAKNSSLKELCVDDCEINSNGGSDLAEFLYTNTTCRTLSLKRCKVGDTAAMYFAGAVLANQYLKLLCMEGNRITDKGCLPLKEALETVNTHLSIRLDDNSLGVEMMSTMQEFCLLRLDHLSDTSPLRAVSSSMSLSDRSSISSPATVNLSRSASSASMASDRSSTLFIASSSLSRPPSASMSTAPSPPVVSARESSSSTFSAFSVGIGGGGGGAVPQSPRLAAAAAAASSSTTAALSRPLPDTNLATMTTSTTATATVAAVIGPSNLLQHAVQMSPRTAVPVRSASTRAMPINGQYAPLAETVFRGALYGPCNESECRCRSFIRAVVGGTICVTCSHGVFDHHQIGQQTSTQYQNMPMNEAVASNDLQQQQQQQQSPSANVNGHYHSMPIVSPHYARGEELLAQRLQGDGTTTSSSSSTAPVGTIYARAFEEFGDVVPPPKPQRAPPVVALPRPNINDTAVLHANIYDLIPESKN